MIPETLVLARKMYEIAEAIETNLPEEKWRTAIKIKNSVNDAYFNIAQIEGAGFNESQDFDCANARKALSALKAMYIFAHKEQMTELDPTLVVVIDTLIEKIDVVNADSKKAARIKDKKDLEPWLEKYRIWQKISKK
ncbi:hypothetical protein H7Y63_00410 [Polaromonas sp.]|nr:hypothetical protein [Candidatus Saccharibacteria bacterium]